MPFMRSPLRARSLSGGLLAVALFAAAGRADVISFDNSCGTLTWGGWCSNFIPPASCIVNNNWNTGTVTTPECSAGPNDPGPADDVILGAFVVTNNASAVVRSVVTSVAFINDVGLEVATTATYNGPVSGQGSFGGTGTHTFNGPFTSTGNGASFNAPARVHLVGGATLTPGTPLFINTETFNHATIMLPAGANSLFIDASGAGPSAVLRILAGGLLLDQGDTVFRGVISTGWLENSGVFRKQGGAGETLLQVSFDNRPGAVVDLLTGSLRTSGSATLAGSANLAAGTIFRAYGDVTIAGTFSTSGDGLFDVGDTSLHVPAGSRLEAQRLKMSGPSVPITLDGPGTIDVTTEAVIAGRWLDATTVNLGSACSAVIDQQVLEMQAASTLNNAGNLAWSVINIAVANGGTVRNLADGVMSCLGPTVIGGFAFNGEGVFKNEGTLRKVSPDRTQVLLPFTNTGRVECVAGRLAFEDFRQNAGQTVLMGGALDADYQQQPLRIHGGQLKGTGQVIGPLEINGGTLAPGDPIGRITLTGSAFGHSLTMLPTGTLDIDIGGPLPGTGYDQVVIQSNHPFLNNSILDGTLRVRLTNGFVPSNETFDILVFDGEVGTIGGQFDVLDLPPGIVLTYLPRGLRLSVAVAPCPVDYNADGFLNQEDLGGYLTAFLDESVPPGPSGTNTAPCQGEPVPYDTLGYAADFNRDCTFNQEDLGGFITEFFLQAESPTSCIPG